MSYEDFPSYIKYTMPEKPSDPKDLPAWKKAFSEWYAKGIKAMEEEKRERRLEQESENDDIIEGHDGGARKRRRNKTNKKTKRTKKTKKINQS
jgi:hypothetical protein